MTVSDQEILSISGQVSARLTALVDDLKAAVVNTKPEVLRTSESRSALQALASDVPQRRRACGAAAVSADQLPQTVAELSQAYDARALSPVEYVAHLVDRIDRTDGILHAFVERTIDQARIWARLSEQRLMSGSRLGPLDGVPIAHKDNIDTAGVATTANCGLFRNRVPARDAAVVAALARSGAVMLGKVGCYEAAFGGPDFDLSWPVPRNPWDLGRSTAGSSSGSAVAIAAGLVLAATGSDTGGSLRDPAALCGVTGYKPRYRTIPTTGMFPFAPSLDTIGPMANNPEDALIMAAAMRGERADAGPLTAPARGLRIGVVPRWSEDIKVDDGVGAVFDTAVAALRESGAEIVTIDLPPLRDFASTGWTIAMAELRETHVEAWAHGADGIGPMLRRGLAAADVIPAFRYICASARSRADQDSGTGV
jgi:aspartyl-tRNA(Asn)/glutamyl-tRNA(Gln) amidotransferase subunit A